MNMKVEFFHVRLTFYSITGMIDKIYNLDSPEHIKSLRFLFTTLKTYIVNKGQTLDIRSGRVAGFMQ